MVPATRPSTTLAMVAAADVDGRAAWAEQSSTLPRTPSPTASSQRRLNGVPAVARSSTADATGAEAKEMTVPTATPPRCIEE